jgi:hypothetical protein
LDEPEEHVRSATRHSGRIAVKIAQIRWGAGNQELVREDENDEEPEDENPVMDGDDERLSGEDEDEEVEEDDWQKLTSAAPGQEGIPLWDRLGQSFLKMTSEVGALHIFLFLFLIPHSYPCR